VREQRDPTGRLPYRLWYEETEIDAIMEDEFQKAGAPVLPGTIAVDIDAFIEGHLGVVPDFVELADGVQGATEFYPDGHVRLKISAGLALRADRQPGAERLIRTTLAHEAAHVLLHRTLFRREAESLFGGAASRQELCRDVRFVAPGYTGEWWEWQANRGMAALLLPRSSVIFEVRRRRALGGAELATALLERELARAFAVSRRAVRYRLQHLGMIKDPGQQELWV